MHLPLSSPNNRWSFSLRGHKSETTGLAALKISFRTPFFGSVQSLRLHSDKIRGLESAQFSTRGLEVTTLSSILNKFAEYLSALLAQTLLAARCCLSHRATWYIFYIWMFVSFVLLWHRSCHVRGVDSGWNWEPELERLNFCFALLVAFGPDMNWSVLKRFGIDGKGPFLWVEMGAGSCIHVGG